LIKAAWKKESAMIIMGGPLQTLLTGTIGFLLLRRYKRRFYSNKEFGLRQWIIIFVSLFWLRQVFNFATAAGAYIIRGRIPMRGDETKLAALFGTPSLGILLPTALIGLALLAYIVFKVIAKKDRVTFMAAGLCGGGLGFYLWMYILGPWLMP
jgi:hypothetical protein